MVQGATAAQARAALRKSKDVMQAAEAIFSGEYDNVADDDVGDARMEEPSSSSKKKIVRPIVCPLFVLACSLLPRC